MLVPGVLAVLAPVVLLCVLPLRAACEEGEVWLPYHSLAIGGGGFTTGIVPTPRSASGTSTVFTRTDVGGVYRLGEDKDTWMPLVDQLTYRDRNRYGGDAIAVSWTNASRVWVSLGAYFDEPGPVLILASESAGDGWRPISPPGWSVRGGANNSTLRSLGERLAVHPKDERILIYGSYLNGLWRTSDADQPAPKWGKVALFPAGPFGALAVAFDPSSPRGDTVYASVPTKSVFVSTDAGVTWRSLATAGTAPAFANRLALALAYAPGPRSTAVVATESGSPVFASAADGVYRYNGTVWEKMRLPQGDVEITGIDVNPFDHLDVIAISNKAEGIARTLNGGESWENAMPEYRQVYELPWWDDSFRHNATVVNFTFGMCGNVRFSTAPMADPARTPAVYLADSWNVWRSDDFGKVKIATLRQMPHGHEEVFVLSMAAPHTTRPSLVTGTADLAGLVHDGPDWNAYPNFTFFGFGAWGAEGTGVAYTEDVLRLDAETTVPRSIVVAQARAFEANNGPLVQVSTDGGRSWVPTKFNESRAVPTGQQVECLGVVVGAFDERTMVVLVGNDRPWASTDGGQTWAAVSGGVPRYNYPLNGFSGNRYNMSRPLAADRPLIKPRGLSATAAARFGYYYADCETGAFFASVDGLKFANIPNLSFPQSHRCVLEPHPTERGGGLWLALGSNGLHFVADANVPGATFRAAVGIAAAHTVAVGAPPTSGAEPSVYIFGLRDSQVQGEGGEAGAEDLHVLASLDRAATFTDVRSSNGKGLGNWPEVLVASRARFGVLAVGSFGRGAFFVNASAVLFVNASAAVL